MKVTLDGKEYEVERMALLNEVRPTDALVLETPATMTYLEAEHIKKAIHANLGCKCVIVAGAKVVGLVRADA